MKRNLLRTPGFVRSAKRLAKKHPLVAAELSSVLNLLAEDADNPKLKSHKLKGKLSGSSACSIGYDMRIVFSIIQHEGKETILLETVGTHDEVY
ncbi:MAG: type II toxin-antitoxin system mRNA interferase toxin, RelE/StbE family [Bacteroidetes bacterium]|nr:MAG: type II toxin-antitoxin system mRNA interferase toxin, RelE/StbE family [Bacteroidota bacterium]